MRAKVVHNRRVRGPSYPDEVIRRARDLRLDGRMPTEIVRILADEYPDLKPGINTVKSWIKGLRPLGPGRPWDFDAASAADRVMVAPLFTGFEKGKNTAAEQWPSQDVADWVVRIRQLRPEWWFDHVFRRARLLAHYDRRIAEGTATPEDQHSRRNVIADMMKEAGDDYYAYEVALQEQVLEELRDEELREVEQASDTPSRTP